MVYDIFDLSHPGNANSPPRVSVFDATIKNGVVRYPAYDDPPYVGSTRRNSPMLAELIEFGRIHNLRAEPGFKPKRIAWLVELRADGSFLTLYPTYTDAKKREAREFGRCPDLSQPEIKRGGSGCRHFLADNVAVVTLFPADEVDDKLRAKHAYFRRMMDDASSSIDTLKPVAAFLGNEEALEQLRADLLQQKAKPTENITFAVDSRILVDGTDWHPWWRKFRCALGDVNKKSTKASTPATKMICLATGELVEPALTHPKIEGLSDVGGLATGDALVSFKQDSFCSFGLEQAQNCVVSEETAADYRAALNHLIRNQSERLGKSRTVYWLDTATQFPDAQNPVKYVVHGADEDEDEEEEAVTPEERQRALEEVTTDRAKKIMQRIKTGASTVLLKSNFFVMTLSGASGRVMVRDWMQGPLADFAAAADAWFDDLAICHRGRQGLAPRPKFMAVAGATVRDLKELASPTVAGLWRSAMLNMPVPEQVLPMVLRRVMLDIVNDETPRHARLGLLKVYLIRNRGDEYMEPYLNEEHPSPAYQAGRLLAVLADLQREALGNVGAGVVQRYYGAASATPALVLGGMIRNAQHHIKALGN
ncbi:MAG: type I-C CRISPR-associated protein Cas8c/Csd1 [Candidatus Competibacteraceae bacterium]|nr:type I-C CRISPR-associated protein Cas8c/Csd1 [Candidatus Competibacteraceae bacterium]